MASITTRSEDEFSGTQFELQPPRHCSPTALTRRATKRRLQPDRSACRNGAVTANLQFEPEKVDAFELGAKYNGRLIDINVAAFYQVFDQFQLNTFNGINFLVEISRLAATPWALRRREASSEAAIPRK
jgi:hypothetical protein